MLRKPGPPQPRLDRLIDVNNDSYYENGFAAPESCYSGRASWRPFAPREAIPPPTKYYETVRLNHPRISLGTVYRNLTILCDQGEIREVNTDAGSARFEIAGDLLYHLVCRKCGDIQDCQLPVDKSLEERMQALTRFRTRPASTRFYRSVLQVPEPCPDRPWLAECFETLARDRSARAGRFQKGLDNLFL